MEKTYYPFSDKIRFEITPEKPVRFRLVLRIPSYAQNSEISAPQGMEVVRGKDSFQIEGNWEQGDAVELDLKFAVRPVYDSRGDVAAAYGPLLFSLPFEAEETIVKKFPDSSLVNRAYKLRTPVDREMRLMDISPFKARKRDKADWLRPWAFPPLELMGELERKSGEKVPVSLVPMGSAILRQTGFKSK